MRAFSRAIETSKPPTSGRSCYPSAERGGTSIKLTPSVSPLSLSSLPPRKRIESKTRQKVRRGLGARPARLLHQGPRVGPVPLLLDAGPGRRRARPRHVLLVPPESRHVRLRRRLEGARGRGRRARRRRGVGAGARSVGRSGGRGRRARVRRGRRRGHGRRRPRRLPPDDGREPRGRVVLEPAALRRRNFRQ